MKPQRIQLSRRKGFKLPPNTVSVARPTKYGNPHRVGFCFTCGAAHTHEESVAEFRALMALTGPYDFTALRGKNLACWCQLDQPCHADVLLKLANDAQPPPALQRDTSKKETP